MRVKTSRSTLQISPKLARRLTGRRDLGGRQVGLGIVRLDRDSAPGGKILSGTGMSDGIVWQGSVFLDHDLGGFHDYFYGIALFQGEILGAVACDDAFNEIVADADDHVSEDIADLNFLDDAGKLVSC